MKIPEGTQPDTLIRIKGHGVENPTRKSRGDHFVRVNITIPKKLNKQQKELLKEFEQEGKRGWF